MEPKKVEIARSGETLKIILPKAMSYQAAREWLTRQEQFEEQVVQVMIDFDVYPLDGARALHKVLDARYGHIHAEGNRGWFGEKNPPRMIEIEVAWRKREHVVWSEFRLPGIEGNLTTAFNEIAGVLQFQLQAIVKRKHEAEIHAIAEAVREYLRDHSIYRSAAIKVAVGGHGKLDMALPPKFLDLGAAERDALILNDHTEASFRANVLAMITHTEICRKHRVPIKRGILLEGPYGTGKTLTAYVTAKACVDHGWTFIYSEAPKAIPSILPFARTYSPAVIFAEDIDSVADEDELYKVRNAIDGVDTKGQDVMVILTTNHVEKIPKALLRPGRLDAMISFREPEPPAVIRLIEFYGRGRIDPKADLVDAAKVLGGHIPAVIREAVERAKLFAIADGGGQDGEVLITQRSLEMAAKHTAEQIKVLKDLTDKPGETEELKFANALRHLLASAPEIAEIVEWVRTQ